MMRMKKMRIGEDENEDDENGEDENWRSWERRR